MSGALRGDKRRAGHVSFSALAHQCEHVSPSIALAWYVFHGDIEFGQMNGPTLRLLHYVASLTSVEARRRNNVENISMIGEQRKFFAGGRNMTEADDASYDCIELLYSVTYLLEASLNVSDTNETG